MNPATFDRTLATFARMWSANMVPIIEKSGGWPGFRYTKEEEAAMTRQLDKFPKSMERYRVFALVNAFITIALFLLISFPAVWTVKALQRTHGRLPGAVIGSSLGATVALGLGIGVPLGLYATCALYRRRPWNADLTASDAELGRRLFGRFFGQTTRLAALVCAGLLVFSLWPEEAPSARPAPALTSDHRDEIGVWQRVAIPLAAASVNLLTFCYYYGRSRKP